MASHGTSKTFTRIPTEVVEDKTLTAIQKTVYLTIAYCAGRGSQSYPSYSYLTEMCRCSRPTVSRALKVLEAKGYIVIQTGYGFGGSSKSNTYHLTSPVFQASKPKASGLRTQQVRFVAKYGRNTNSEK